MYVLTITSVHITALTVVSSEQVLMETIFFTVVVCSNNDTQHTLTCVHTSVNNIGDFLRTRWTPDVTANITNVSRTLVAAGVTHQMFNYSALSPGYYTFEMFYKFRSDSLFEAACLCHCPCSSTIVVEVKG